MSLTLSLFISDDEVAKITSFMEGMERRTVREAILPILKEHLEPLVESEKAYLSGHSISGALVASLSARTAGGGRDRPNTMTAFSAPTAMSKTLQGLWSQGRAQQQGWAARMKPIRNRRRVFYASIVHQGHRIVKRNAAGELYDTGKRTVAVPFAQQAMDSMGESQGEAAASEIMDHIIGES